MRDAKCLSNVVDLDHHWRKKESRRHIYIRHFVRKMHSCWSRCQVNVGWRVLGTASSKYRAIWHVLSRSTLIAVEPPSGKRSSDSSSGPRVRLYTLSVHTDTYIHVYAHVLCTCLLADSSKEKKEDGERENRAQENRLDGEKVARRQLQAYRCQSVNWKSLTAPRPSRILHFYPPWALFAIRHSACTAFHHVFFVCYPLPRCEAPRRERRRNRVILQINLPGGIRTKPSRSENGL